MAGGEAILDFPTADLSTGVGDMDVQLPGQQAWDNSVSEAASLRIYNQNYLYGPTGPRAWDIKQDGLGDCYFVGELGSFAEQNPSVIENAISYNPDRRSFDVTFEAFAFNFGDIGNPQPSSEKAQQEPLSPHIPNVLADPLFLPVRIEVTQADIQDNIRRGGGSTVDNGWGPIWPAVMEAAYAKWHDPHDLDHGYELIANGGDVGHVAYHLTGEPGHVVETEDGRIINPWTDQYEGADPLLPLIGDFNSRNAVVLETARHETYPGLLPNHVYMATRVDRAADNQPVLVVRNPHNGENPVSTVRINALNTMTRIFASPPPSTARLNEQIMDLLKPALEPAPMTLDRADF